MTRKAAARRGEEPEIFVEAAKRLGWRQDPDDGLWYPLDVLGSETEPPKPLKTAMEVCEFDGEATD